MNPLGLAALGGALWWLSRLHRNPDGAGFRDKSGRFHPIRSSEWYQPSLLDEPESFGPVSTPAIAPERVEVMSTSAATPDWLDGEGDRPRRPLETRRVRNGGIPVRPANDLVTRYTIVKAQDGSSEAIERTTTSDSTPDQNSRQRILNLYLDKGVAHWIIAYDDTGKTPMPGMASFKTRDVAQAWMKQLTHDLNAGSRDHSPREIDERLMILTSFRRLPPAYQTPTPTTMQETNAERQRQSARERAAEYKRLADVIADPAKAQGIDVGDMVHAIYTANYKRYEVKGVITKRLTSSWKVRPIEERELKYRSGAASPRDNYKPYQNAREMTLPGKTDKGWTQNNGITGKTFITPAAPALAATATRYSSPKELLTGSLDEDARLKLYASAPPEVSDKLLQVHAIGKRRYQLQAEFERTMAGYHIRGEPRRHAAVKRDIQALNKEAKKYPRLEDLYEQWEVLTR